MSYHHYRKQPSTCGRTANKPRYIAVGFQTLTPENVLLDASKFIDCNVSDVKVFLNNNVYPYNNLNADFTSNAENYQEMYMTLLQIQASYYKCPNIVNMYAPDITWFPFQAIFAIDCSQSDDSLLNSTVDVRIEISARANIPPHSRAFCLIIHDNAITYSPFDGIVNKAI